MKLKILDHEFEVKFVEQGPWDDQSMGRACTKEGVIYLNKDLAPDVQRSTLLHEVLHTIETLYSLDLKEHVIDIFALGLYSFLRNNPHVLEFLLEGSGSRSNNRDARYHASGGREKRKRGR